MFCVTKQLWALLPPCDTSIHSFFKKGLYNSIKKCFLEIDSDRRVFFYLDLNILDESVLIIEYIFQITNKHYGYLKSVLDHLDHSTRRPLSFSHRTLYFVVVVFSISGNCILEICHDLVSYNPTRRPIVFDEVSYVDVFTL